MSKNSTKLGHATDGEIVRREYDLGTPDEIRKRYEKNLPQTAAEARAATQAALDYQSNYQKLWDQLLPQEEE